MSFKAILNEAECTDLDEALEKTSWKGGGHLLALLKPSGQ